MFLRNSWIAFSLLIIFLCLLLYFQNNTSTKSLIWEQHKVLDYSQDELRTLIDLNKKINPLNLEGIISDFVQKNRLAGTKTRVMEINAGNGQVLLELKKLFPDVEFYAINQEKSHTFYRRESFIPTALKFNIFSKSELEKIELPFVIFKDLDEGQKIPYLEEKFDLVFSQNSISQFKYKFELWAEILRILKFGGISIHTDLSGLHVYSNGELLDLRTLFAELRKDHFNIRLLDNSQSVIFKKTEDLKSGLTLIPHIPLGQKQSKEKFKNFPMGYNLNQ